MMPLSEQTFASGRRIKLLLYGQPGVGKTVFAAQFPNPAVWDLENGMLSVISMAQSGTVDIDLTNLFVEKIAMSENPKSDKSFDTLTSSVGDLLEREAAGETPVRDTFIFDSFSAINRSVMMKALQEANRVGVSKSLMKLTKSGYIPTTQADYLAAMQIVEKFIYWLTEEVDKNVVITAHEYVMTDSSGAIIGYRPLLHGQLRERLPALFDEVWRFQIKKKERQIVTVGDHRFPAKSRLGCLDPVEGANFEAIRTKVAKFHNVPAEKLWTQPEK